MPFSSNQSVSVNGNISNGVINTGNGTSINVTQNAVSQDTEKEQLRQDLQKLEESIKRLEAENPQASQSDKQMYVTLGTPQLVRDRLLAALTSGGKAAISEFLDNAYARIVVAIIEGWRS